MSLSKLLGTTVKPTEPATLPRTTEALAIKQEHIYLQEEMKASVLEVKLIVSPHHQLV